MSQLKYRFSKILALLLLILLMAGSAYILSVVPYKDLLNQSYQIKQALAELGYSAPLIFLLATTLFTALGVPRLLFCTLAGIVFGFEWGIVISHLGTILGAYITFAFARWAGREWVQKRFPKITTLAQSSKVSGWHSVLLMRQLPITGLYNSILLGLSSVSHWHFWVGTFIGFLPLGITATLIGAGVIQADLVSLGKYLAIAACAFYILPLLLKWFLAQWRQKNA